MMKHNTLNFWIEEEEIKPTEAPLQTSPSEGPPAAMPGQGQQSTKEAPPPQSSSESTPEMDDTITPDIPPEENKEENFETWKLSFFKDSVNGNVNDLIESIYKIREEDLEPYQRKFIEDNLQILFLKQNSNIEKANKELRKLVNSELDENNPGVSLCNHFENILKKMPELMSVFIKLKGTLGMKGDLHRKYLAAIAGAVQVGSGAENEDIIYNDTNYSIKISTRFNEKWGKVDLGKWSLKTNDPEKFLDEVELKRLEEGSPEEKEVLRKRIITDAIVDFYKERTFLINTVGGDGTVYMLGLDLNSCLSNAYTEGKLVVKFINADDNECSLDLNGNMVPYLKIKINFIIETEALDENGMPKKEELDFIERINGNLYFTATLDTIKKATATLNGLSLKEFPYSGNPSELFTIQRCVPSANEILLRSC